MLLQAAGSDFQSYRTGHFLIAYNVDPALVESLSLRLEQTYDSVSRFCGRSGFAIKTLNRPLEVVFLDTWPDYERYARQAHFKSKGTYGFYYDRTNRSAFFNVENDPDLIKLHATIQAARENVGRMEETLKSIRGNQPMEIVYGDGRREKVTRSQAKDQLESARRRLKSLDVQSQNYSDRINRTVVQHEIAHQVLYNTGVHVRGAMNPRWLVEGLACIFETPPGGEGVGLGAINQARLKDFRKAVAGESELRVLTSSMYADAVTVGRMVSVNDLVCKHELFDERGDQGAMYYAAAWALVHYLHRAQNKPLSAYLQDLGARPPSTLISPEAEVALFERHFGPLDEAFIARFSGFVLKLPYRSPAGEIQ